jgi:hypothetical protein
MTVGELMRLLAPHPWDSDVYIEDLDTRWLFTKFQVTKGSTGHDDYPGKPDAVFLWAESYADREET